MILYTRTAGRSSCSKTVDNTQLIISILVAILLVARYMRQGGLVLAAGRVRSKGKKNSKKREKICPTQNTPRHPQQPGDRDQLETARGETRPTR